MNMFNKHDLRQKAKRIRSTLDMRAISQAIVANVRESIVYKAASRVMLFYPKGNEVDLRDLFKDDKLFYLPRVNGDELEVCRYCEGDELALSEFGVLEPTGECVDKSELDLVVVPALCVDEKCNRLGYGKGFYDRFLKDYPNMSIIVIPEELVFTDVCSCERDMCCNSFITQKKASVDRG